MRTRWFSFLLCLYIASTIGSSPFLYITIFLSKLTKLRQDIYSNSFYILVGAIPDDSDHHDETPIPDEVTETVTEHEHKHESLSSGTIESRGTLIHALFENYDK